MMPVSWRLCAQPPSSADPELVHPEAWPTGKPLVFLSQTSVKCTAVNFIRSAGPGSGPRKNPGVCRRCASLQISKQNPEYFCTWSQIIRSQFLRTLGAILGFLWVRLWLPSPGTQPISQSNPLSDWNTWLDSCCCFIETNRRAFLIQFSRQEPNNGWSSPRGNWFPFAQAEQEIQWLQSGPWFLHDNT